jgi:hypothetical protein
MISSNDSPLMNLFRLNSTPILLSKHATDFCSIAVMTMLRFLPRIYTADECDDFRRVRSQKHFITCSPERDCRCQRQASKTNIQHRRISSPLCMVLSSWRTHRRLYPAPCGIHYVLIAHTQSGNADVDAVFDCLGAFGGIPHPSRLFRYTTTVYLPSARHFAYRIHGRQREGSPQSVVQVYND